MQKPMWLWFDLGMKGDYESLYAWLDNHDATECGHNAAFLKYEIPDDGRFILGKRKAAPWQGYGDAATEEDA